jgi:FMNH2-dependent dimethyl sulfone monooxygenase
MALKIGIYLPIYGGWYPNQVQEEEKLPSFEYVKQVAQEAERIGIDSLWIPDHLLNPIKGEDAPSLEAWTLATAVLEATEKVYVAHTTLCEAFRYPAVLAKSAATLNEISESRLWLSLGAGWYKREFESYGLSFMDHKERIARAKETLQIIKKMWEEESVNYKGKYYSVTKGTLEPKPDPLPFIWYAGMTDESQELAAEEADGWLMKSSNLEEAQEHIIDMQKRLKKYNRDNIELAIPALTFVRETDEEAKKHVEYLLGDEKEILFDTLDTGLVGSYESAAEKIAQLEDMGIEHIILKLTPILRELQNVKKLIDMIKK